MASWEAGTGWVERAAWVPLVLALSLPGCQTGSPAAIPAAVPAKPAETTPFAVPRLEEVTESAGVRWTHNACRTGRKLLPETVGGGGGFLDYDQDGWLDILLINGAPLPGYQGPRPQLALYRNNRDGTFTEVPDKAGLQTTAYGMGAAIADYDNDGWPDVYLTAVGRTQLFRNVKGRFVDVTRASGTAVDGFTTGAAWIDFDRDGKLDLFVARYVEWTPETDLPCGPENARQYCPPNQYKGAPPVLFRNRGDGTFADVSQRAGVLGHPSKTLAVTPYDFNGDGWPDLHLANDTEPDALLLNNRDGTFREAGLSAGVAIGTDGIPTGSMGVDIATPFRDGNAVIAVGDFAGQELSLFIQTARGERLLFENRKQEAGVAEPTRTMTTFGLLFADVDLDGWPDLLVMNGHIDDDPSLHVGSASVAYRQRPQLFQNRRDGTFRDVGQTAGWTRPLIGRGLAVGDYDNDGKPDFLTFENGGPARLWHNRTPAAGQWLGVELIGKRSPRDGTGAVVILEGLSGSQTRFASTARSYLSANEPRIHFGVGSQPPARLIVRWPSGSVTTLENPPLNRYLRVEEEAEPGIAK